MAHAGEIRNFGTGVEFDLALNNRIKMATCRSRRVVASPSYMSPESASKHLGIQIKSESAAPVLAPTHRILRPLIKNIRDWKEDGQVKAESPRVCQTSFSHTKVQSEQFFKYVLRLACTFGIFTNQKNFEEKIQMTSRTGFLTIVATGLMVVFQPILADHVDGSDFLLWQRNFSFAPLETAEILIEQAYASPRHSITLTFAVNNEFGLILGLIETTVPANDPPNNHRNHGFGFVTMEIGASRDGVLLINGERFDDLTANPTTGRYAVGISLFSSRSPASGRGNARFGNATLSIVAPDGATRTSGEILTDPNSGKKVSG